MLPRKLDLHMHDVEIWIIHATAMTTHQSVRQRFHPHLFPLLRITEDAKGNCSTIIIPSTGLEEFQRIISEMVKTEKALPVKQSAPPA